MNVGEWLLFAAVLLVVPILTAGTIRKIKARLQNRVGPPLLQPLYNVVKLWRKGETVSEDATWIFRGAAVINLAVVLVVAALLPWVSFKPGLTGDDIFLFIYLLASARFFGILAALDTGSPFSAFSSSREATLSLLVEPAIVLSLVALALGAHSTSLGSIFAYGAAAGPAAAPVWIVAGCGLFLSSLVELSRMPVDDPTTHLELTMVHEAMLIENSGPNLALAEIAYTVRLTFLYGLTVQCFLHAVYAVAPVGMTLLAVLSVLGIFLLAAGTALLETVTVKLKWTRCPEFIAYALTMGLFACMAAIFRGGV